MKNKLLKNFFFHFFLLLVHNIRGIEFLIGLVFNSLTTVARIEQLHDSLATVLQVKISYFKLQQS